MIMTSMEEFTTSIEELFERVGQDLNARHDVTACRLRHPPTTVSLRVV